MTDDNYDKFYNDVINVWKSGGINGQEGGWAGLYYGIFSSIINENNFKKCAEIGIGYGLHAREILDNTNIEKLYLIDPLEYYPNDEFANDIIKNGGFEVLLKNIRTHLKPHETRYTLYRTPSISITSEQIPDESLDAVFIDGDHSFGAVYCDLQFWWNKLKKGGWMLGDDYSSCHPGVPKAVNKFSQTYGVKFELLFKNENNTYPIYKIIKE